MTSLRTVGSQNMHLRMHRKFYKSILLGSCDLGRGVVLGVRKYFCDYYAIYRSQFGPVLELLCIFILFSVKYYHFGCCVGVFGMSEGVLKVFPLT